MGNHTSGKASIVNNIFTANNNFQIFESGAFATYANNLITNSGNGMFYSYGAHIIHDIRYFNGNPKIRYAAGNIGSSPSFVDAAAFNYRLNRGSPAIDAGPVGRRSADRHHERAPAAGAASGHRRVRVHPLITA